MAVVADPVLGLSRTVCSEGCLLTSTVPSWTVTAVAVCANNPAGLELYASSTTPASDSYDSMSRVCPMIIAATTGPTPKISVTVVPDARTAASSRCFEARICVSR